MTTLVLGPAPRELEALIERRRWAGLDRLDEVWQGVRHMVPGPSIEHADIGQQPAARPPWWQGCTDDERVQHR